MHNNCLPVLPNMHDYQQSHDTFDSCIKDGLGQSFEVFFNGELVQEKQINSITSTFNYGISAMNPNRFSRKKHCLTCR